jgi:hypothetical protein
MRIPSLWHRSTLVSAVLFLAPLPTGPLAAQGFCSDLSGPDLDRCRVDYHANLDGVMAIVLRRALEGKPTALQSRIRQEQAAWVSARNRAGGITPQRRTPTAARMDTVIKLTESRITELGQQALGTAPWLIGLLLGGGGSPTDSVTDVIAMRNDLWRFAAWQEGWIQGGEPEYAKQGQIGSFRPTTGHAISVLHASEGGWSAIVTSDLSNAICGMFRGQVESGDQNLEVEGRVTCW